MTLSACETGLGQLAQGEGVLGLPRLFLRAGAQSVLMTLWPVHDEFASHLMPEFYDQFLNHKLSKAEALAEAKRSALHAKIKDHGVYYQHPFFWAPFVLYGDPGVSRGFVIFPIIVAIITGLLCLVFVLALHVHRSFQRGRRTYSS